jgi:hypothetical protein
MRNEEWNVAWGVREIEMGKVKNNQGSIALLLLIRLLAPISFLKHA